MQLLLEALTYYRDSDEPLSVIIILVVRVTLVVATGWLAGRAVARASAAVQQRVWLLAVLGTLVVPLVWALTPHWRLPLLAVQVQGAPPARFAVVPHTADAAWPEVLVAVWITGAAAGLAYMTLGIVLARRLFARSLPSREAGWLEALGSVRRETGTSRRVDLRIAPCPMSPAVWSFRRVRILVPLESFSWPQELKRTVLLHELAHVTRRDCVWQMIATLACAVWWFHPLVWYAAGRARALAEQAADDCVIRSGRRRADYAQGLLTIASAVGWARVPSAAQAMFHPSHLERRLRAILDPTRRRNALGGGPSAASIAIACVLMALLATLTSSVVRAVPAPATPAAGATTDVEADVNETRAPATEAVMLPSGQRFVAIPVELIRPVAPLSPQPTFQLIPNWDQGRQADMLIPNHKHGMSETVLVEQAKAHLAARAVAAARHASSTSGAAGPVASVAVNR